jgi:asparagine synthase (glutamine-hydrolysing)
VTPEDARAVIPLLPNLYDEPFSDSSQIPTFLVSQLARRKVTVSLSGDGGDELFAGYDRYAWMRRINRYKSVLNGSLAGLSSSLLGTVASRPFDWGWKLAAGGKSGGRVQLTRDRMTKLSEIFNHQPDENVYLDLLSHWKNPETIVRDGHEPKTILLNKSQWPAINNFTETMMYLDMMTYLPDDILAKVDRASMGVSLETRAPLLDDHRVIEFAWRLPLSMKVRNGQSKWILRQVLDRHVPKTLIERPKKGFGVPINSWLRGPLKEWAASLLDETLLKKQGYFNPTPIRQKWSEHLTGENNWQYYIWDILMFQSWLVQNAS